MKSAYEEKAVIIASERMTEEDWELIENRNLIIIDKNLSVKLLSID
jgi:predicted glutamine amidotransferase